MKREIHYELNGNPVTQEVTPETLLLDAVRQWTTAPKEACGVGVCGACTVLVNDQPVSSCLYLAALVDGQTVWTADGLVQRFPRLAQSFVEHEGLQCGICTPGQFTAACALLLENPHPDEATIRHYMAGNLCRCTGYAAIVRSIHGAV
ncbi:MAG: (2Fe-2S)-binding protein [Firmicutes bacterium]|nr:(2Fe-2S)-binding protein [Alicyclobacillaceae bacterium]MCL6498245.1 (2Fe-2S)-binding protein [Bacillota bacterium]